MPSWPRRSESIWRERRASRTRCIPAMWYPIYPRDTCSTPRPSIPRRHHSTTIYPLLPMLRPREPHPLAEAISSCSSSSILLLLPPRWIGMRSPPRRRRPPRRREGNPRVPTTTRLRVPTDARTIPVRRRFPRMGRCTSRSRMRRIIPRSRRCCCRRCRCCWRVRLRHRPSTNRTMGKWRWSLGHHCLFPRWQHCPSRRHRQPEEGMH
mmetsp:Transcript_22938/g.55295  ORF Transcript_22938/g.55295 Transcript_22938/m.55295 type:complete len:208 (-) Transcript_22938:708-1331(-)